MNINESVIRNGITAQTVSKLIEQHEVYTERYRTLKGYYEGKQAIQNRRKKGGGKANNRIVCNHAKYIVDVSQAYLVGNPVTYASSTEYDIEALKNEYLEQDIASVDSEIVKDFLIYGKAYELVYADEESKVKSVLLNPCSAFVVYSDDAAERPLMAVQYYREYNIDGIVTGITVNAYDNKTIYHFHANSDNIKAISLMDEQSHYFGLVPIIEYKNNAEEQGDFEQLIPMIDAYNILQSDRVNDKEQFVDCFLFMKNIEVDTEQASKLKEEKILIGYEDSDVKYISKSLQESDVKVLRDDLKEDIHRFSMVPDLSDESFGNNLSGVAIKYKLLCFEQHIKNKERFFAKGLKMRFKMYNNYLALKNAMQLVPVHRVDIVFTYNLPANEKELSEIVSTLQGIVSNETLIDILPFISDAKEEAELAATEKAEEYRKEIAATSELASRGY